jgi:hypothetical protein
MIVEVDDKDLEALLFAASAVKTIERVLEQHRRDPFVKSHALTMPAHDRLTTALNHARRADTNPLWNEPLTQQDIDFLADLVGSGSYRDYSHSSYTDAKSFLNTLAAKGMVTLGERRYAYLWAGASTPELSKEIIGLSVKPTVRGVRAVAEASR